jgi:putative ATP-dependent endonuclease of the OLD family
VLPYLRNRPQNAFGLANVEVRGFRTAREVSFSPGPLCALVGEANAGKSNVLGAIRAVLDPEAAPLTATDTAEDGDGEIAIRVRLAGAGEPTLEGSPGRHTVSDSADSPPVLFLPANARAADVLAAGSHQGAEAPQAVQVFKSALAHDSPTSAAHALSIINALESCCSRGLGGLVLLIEEPELYLRPQAQRYLYRLLRDFSLGGNQTIYSTQSPAFLNVARLDELVFVERLPQTGTRALQPEPVSADEDFRVMTEFDTARSELFLARAAVLVEGLTEKLVRLRGGCGTHWP